MYHIFTYFEAPDDYDDGGDIQSSSSQSLLPPEATTSSSTSAESPLRHDTLGAQSFNASSDEKPKLESDSIPPVIDDLLVFKASECKLLIQW